MKEKYRVTIIRKESGYIQLTREWLLREGFWKPLYGCVVPNLVLCPLVAPSWVQDFWKVIHAEADV